MDDSAVVLEGVTRSYGGGATEVVALHQVSVGFARGGFTAVMGPSGSGKSTLLRVAIARALLARPEVLFADEPTGALDRGTGRGVLTLLREAVDEFGQTVVMVTHDPEAAAQADTALFLTDGRIVDVLDGPSVEQIGIRLGGRR
ncbi:ATP-binding cassette domain-containing protein [Streptosporangium sp. NPDC023615]|uniref:ATP-binding cassette domain-containing protein n=1 Tax=Streptosporangium sp. NPDC023615 TaxID=3154794 RepID=UPI0034159A46